MTRETVKKFVFPLLFPYWYWYQSLHSKLEIICDLLNEGFLVYSIGNCLWDFFHRLFGLITHLKVFKKKIAEDSL